MGPDGGPDVPRRWARWVVLGVAVTALSACSSSDPADRDAAAEPDVTSTAPDGTGTADGATSAVPDGATSADDVGDVTLPADPVNGQPILIETQMKSISAGKIVARSFIGDSPFCRDGKVRAEHGSPDVGLVHATYVCRDGRLSIGYSPMQRSYVQSTPWKVVEGSGRYEGLRGEGWMVVRFDEASGEGQEIFTGTVSR